MEFFQNDRVIRLRSHYEKFLFAEDNQESVRQGKDRSFVGALWTVEVVTGSNSVIRLKSNCGKYLTASDEPFLKGLSSGQKVLQTLSSPLDPTVQWEPIKHGKHIRLKSRSSHRFLRGSGGLPPWRDSVTHYPAEDETDKSSLEWDVEINVEDTTPVPDPASRRRDRMTRVQIAVGTAGVMAAAAGAAVGTANIVSGAL